MTIKPIEGNRIDQEADVMDHPQKTHKHHEEINVKDVTQDRNSAQESRPESPRRKWLPLVLALVIGGGILGWEYREALYPLLGSPLLFLLICVGMHFLMHRGHGGRGGGGSGS
jgi:hypothetical protein